LLFRYLHDDAFLAFSREHKHLYAACLLDLYDRYFNGVPAFPTPQEVTHSVYDTMRANSLLWSEADDFGEPLPEVISAGRRRIKRASANKTESADKALLIARQIYARLIAWGWLEEEEYGLRVTVDMSMGPLLEDFAAACGMPVEELRVMEAGGSAWLRSERDAEAVSYGLDHYGVIVIEESGGMGAGVRLKFTRQDVRQIARLEGEGGIVGSDDAP
jgi:hypothetical protein